MSLYPEYPLANFPDNLISVDKMTTPTGAQLAKIAIYNNYLKNSQYSEAAAYLTANPDLKSCRLDTNTFNTLVDEMGATQKYYKEDVQTMVTTLASRTVSIDDSAPQSTYAYSGTKVEAIKTKDKTIVYVKLLANGWTHTTSGDDDIYTQTVTQDISSIALTYTNADTPVLCKQDFSSLTETSVDAYHKNFSIVNSGYGEVGTSGATFVVYEPISVDVIVGLKGV